jgi:hypothetical protein
MVATSASLEEARREPARRAGRSIFVSMPWVPAIAALITLLALLTLDAFLGDDELPIAVLALAIGITGAYAVWLINLAVVARASTPAAAYPRQYAELRDQLRALEAQLMAAKRTDEEQAECRWCDLAGRELNAARDRLGLDRQSRADADEVASRDRGWARGWAYSDVWNAIHRAEEALVFHMDPDELRAAAIDSRLTIEGSPLAESLSEELAVIESQLDDSGGVPAGMALRLMRVRRRINRFQDDRWDGLRTARDRLGSSALLTSWAFFSLIALAALWGVETYTLAAAGVYFLVASLVGLFAQLRADAARDDALEDFGLAQVRLTQTMLASGLAGIAGVVLWRLAGVASDVSFEAIFDLAINPMGVVIAAAFGLSPQLLIAGLRAKGEQYKAEITSLHTATAADTEDEHLAKRRTQESIARQSAAG